MNETSDPKSLTIGVLMGGPSSEHEISLKSGHGVADALRQRGWRVEEVVIAQGLTIEQASAALRRELAQRSIDVAFIALHGPFGEDGTVQQVCEKLGVIYTGSDARASWLGLDKVESRERFEQAGLSVPTWRLIDSVRADVATVDIRGLELPVVVKPSSQGSSIGITIVAKPEQLAPALAEAARYDTRILVEEYVRGREVTVGILGDEALPVIEIKPAHQFFDFTAKYTPGQTEYIVPARLTGDVAARIQRAGLAAHKAIGCRHFSRVDLILSEAGEPVVLEVNTIPGFTATSLLPKAAACMGLSYGELCERIVRMAIDEPRSAAALAGGGRQNLAAT